MKLKMRKITAVILAVLCMVSLFAVNVSAAGKTKSVMLNKSEIGLVTGGKYTLNEIVSGFGKYTLEWSSSDKNVASVNNGVVTAKKAGTTVITAKVKGSAAKAVCKVYVRKKAKNAQDLVNNMGPGINLGNTLESNPEGDNWYEEGVQELDFEIKWGNPRTTKEHITAMKKAGFTTIRIPVNWSWHGDYDTGEISDEWMDRVQEVVDYAYDLGMYVILNQHHDWNLNITYASKDTDRKKFKKSWEMIAERFKDYDEKLIFEAKNEPCAYDENSSYWVPEKEHIDCLNELYKVFDDTVRASGGNNKTRYLMVEPYGVTSEESAIMGLKIPNNDKRVIVSAHVYSQNLSVDWDNMDNGAFDDSIKAETDASFALLEKAYIKKRIPVSITEWGTFDKHNIADRVKYAEYFTKTAKKYKISCVWWDQGNAGPNKQTKQLGLYDRKNDKWYFPEIVKVITGKNVK